MPIYKPTEIELLKEFLGVFAKKKELRYLNDRYKGTIYFVIGILVSIYREWYGPPRKYTDEHVSQRLFRNVAYDDIWVRYNLYALIETLRRISENLPETPYEPYNTPLIEFPIKREFVHSLLDDALPFLDIAARIKKDKKRRVYCTKSNVYFSGTSYECGKWILYSTEVPKGTWSALMYPTVSVLLLRQSIELRLKNAFGIDYTFDPRTQKYVSIGFKELVRLLTVGRHFIEFPVETSLLLKVYRWSNFFVHLGICDYAWKMDWAYHVLMPLFKPGQYGNTISRFGAIRIVEHFYSSIDIYLSIFKGRPINIGRKRGPEAFIVPSL